jgi:hypothetical protein
MNDSIYLQELRRLEQTWQVADAKLSTAKRVGGIAAVLAGILAVRIWNYPGAGLGGFVVGYAVSIIPFYMPAQRAKDIYFRAAKLGKYSKSPFDTTD